MDGWVDEWMGCYCVSTSPRPSLVTVSEVRLCDRVIGGWEGLLPWRHTFNICWPGRVAHRRKR